MLFRKLNDMKRNVRIFLPVLLVGLAAFFIFATNDTSQPEAGTQPEAEPYVPGPGFNEYWYAGKAELNSYTLEQARYGEVHSGDAVLMFVTEDFDTKTHTKAQTGGVPVLKVNFDKKFLTGVYPYSMLMTAASPIDINRHPHAITVTGSVQEWCGHTFTQFNLEGNSYQYTGHSYFPGEGDDQKRLDVTWMEDELWTRLRIDPEGLPTGKFKMMPGVYELRLRHQASTPVQVMGTRGDASDGTDAGEYTIEYADGSRRLSIQFDKEFPYTILGWNETFKSGWGDRARELTTTARLKKSIMLDYWSKNSNGDRKLRERLDLPY